MMVERLLGERSLTLWLLSLLCIYFAFEAAFFLYTRYIHPLVVWVLLINLASAASLIALRKIVVLFAALSLAMSLAVFGYDQALSQDAILSAEYLAWVLSDKSALAAVADAAARWAFHGWFLLYAIYLSRKGNLR